MDDTKDNSKNDSKDDSIEIDFSWVKKLFTKKNDTTSSHNDSRAEHRSTERHEHEIKEKQDSDYNDSAEGNAHTVKNHPKKEHHSKDRPHSKNEPYPSTESTKEKPILIDWQKIWSFFWKYRAIFLILIPLIFSIYIRMMPWYLPITDVWSENALRNQVKSTVAEQLIQKYPNLPVQQRNELVEQNYQKIITENQAAFDAQVKSQSAYFKTRYMTHDGKHMLLDIDSYAYYRETRNYIENGHLGNSLKEGRPWDSYSFAPLGGEAGDNLNIRLNAWVYKLFKFFNDSTDLMTIMFLLPMVVAVLAVIPAFFIGQKFGGDIGGFFSAILIAANPAYISRTTAGVPDTDFFTLIFPLLIVWFLIETFDFPTLKKRLLAAFATGLTIALYSWAWSGWWYIFDFAIAAIIADLIIRYLLALREKKSALLILKDHLYILIMLVASTLILVSIVRSPEWVTWPVTQPLTFINIQAGTKLDYWPNVYTTVAELNPMDINSIFNNIGGRFVAFLALLGMLLTILTKDQHGHRNYKYFILLTLWFLASFYASTKGVRFLALLALPTSIALGAFVGQVYYLVSNWLKKNMNIPLIASRIILVLILFIPLLSQPIQSSTAQAAQNMPLISDAWWDSLTEIKDSTPPNTIITSWWDFGHWFKAIADRPVTFDGGTQNTPLAFWVGKALLTSHEDEAMGILRMIDCGSTNAFDEIAKQHVVDTVKGVDLLLQSVSVSREKAKKILENNKLNPEPILPFTHCTPAGGIFITSEDMVGKAGVWAHFGSWNFTRSQIYVNTVGKSRVDALLFMKTLGVSDQLSEQYYSEIKGLKDERAINSWIAPWPSFGGGISCTMNADIARCTNGLEVNMTTFVSNPVNNQSPVHQLIYIKNGTYTVDRFEKYQNDIDIILVPPYTGTFQAIMAQHPLGSSVFVRLFFLEGQGSDHFIKLGDRRAISNERIITWNVSWEGNANNTKFGNPEPTPQPILTTPTNTTKTNSIKTNFIRTNSTKMNLARVNTQQNENKTSFENVTNRSLNKIE